MQVFGGRVGALAPKKFFAVPPMRNLGGTAGDSLSFGTNCWLSRPIIVYWRCICYHIFYPLTPDLCLFWLGTANIEIHHRNIELQVQIKAKFIILFENQHEFLIGSGF